MSLNEANRLSIMQQIDKKILTLKRASEELGLSQGQIKRVRKCYLIEGAEGLLSKHRGKVSQNRIDPKLKAQVVRILSSEEYAGFGPTFAQEKLRKWYGYLLSDEIIRKWMIEEGLWKNKKQKMVRIYQRRIRRERFGELLQGDGFSHAWLVQFIDMVYT